MKINRIITSINENPDYASFAELVCMTWNKLGYSVTLNIIGPDLLKPARHRQPSPKFVENIGRWADIQIWPKLVGVKSSKQSQFIRMICASHPLLASDTLMIADIDMIPLSAAPLESYGRVPEDHLAQFGYEHPAFQSHPDIGKWPMHGTAARGSTFAEIVNPNNLKYSELVDYWNSRPPHLADLRSIPNGLRYFCDESLLKCLTDIWQGKFDRITKIRREEAGDFKQHKSGGYAVYGRICRTEWKSLENENLDDYFEIHGPLPCDLEGFYKPVLQYLRKK
jgi:hypothetical protein